MSAPKVNFIKIVLLVLGLLSLVVIVRSYGFDVFFDEIKTSGWQILWLSLTFVPTLFLYGLSWLLMTEIVYKTRLDYLKWPLRFFGYSMISISWNNLTPFLKVGGEPLKYMLLSRHMNKKTALQSTVSYNLIHILATLLAFIIASVVTLLMYEVAFRATLMGGILGVLALFILFVWLLLNKTVWKYKKIDLKNKIVKRIWVYFWWSIRKNKSFCRNKPLRVLISLMTDTLARFIEGLTFYFAFIIINQHVPMIVCALLDVFRTFVDTLLFFIPYQLGGREAGIKLALTGIYNLKDVSFLWPSMAYRFVEIIWIIIGYILWIKWNSSFKASK